MDRRILTDAQIEAIIASECVLEAKDRLATSNTVRFTMDLPTEIKAVLQESLGLDLPDQVPLRWIKGDTPSHADAGQSVFERTHLVYLTDSEGEFHLGEESFPICKGESFVFPQGTLHGTSRTGDIPRLLLGPMSEDAEPVGGFQVLDILMILVWVPLLLDKPPVEQLEDLQSGVLPPTVQGVPTRLSRIRMDMK